MAATPPHSSIDRTMTALASAIATPSTTPPMTASAVAVTRQRRRAWTEPRAAMAGRYPAGARITRDLVDSALGPGVGFRWLALPALVEFL